MQLKTAYNLAKETINDWLDHRAMSLAASLAFYTVLSLAPLLVMAVSVAGIFYGEDAARGHITQQLQNLLGPEGGDAVQAILAHAKEPKAGLIGTIIGLVVLLFGASGVFGELQESMNTIWGVKTKPGRALRGIVAERFFSFAMVLGVAFLLLVSLLLSAALEAVANVMRDQIPGGPVIWIVLNLGISFAIITFLFALIFKFVPDVKIGWRDVGYGAAFTAALFTIGKFGIGFYLGNASVGSPYGAAGSLVVLVVWVYYSAQILFLGAEFTQVYASHCGSHILPSDNAIAFTTQEIVHETVTEAKAAKRENDASAETNRASLAAPRDGRTPAAPREPNVATGDLGAHLDGRVSSH